MSLLEAARRKARAIKRETYVLYLACRDPRTPWYAKALAGGVVAYALSPIDLIPDFIPVLGYLDDLVLVPLGIAAALKLIPESVLVDCRERARVVVDRPASRGGAAVVVAIWIVAAAAVLWMIREALP